MSAAELIEVDGIAEGHTEPVDRLWLACLLRLIQDAQNHVSGKGTQWLWEDFEQAHHDLMKCGPMTRHVCERTGHEPEAVSEHFRRWCAEHG